MERFLIRKFATASSSQDETTTKKQKTNEKCVKWHTLHASLLLRQDSSCPNKNASKIACFDLDETLQKTKSGKKPFLTHENDFTFRDQSVRTALNLLHENGYKIVIFSNQGMVKSAVDGKKAEQIRKRVEIFAGEVRAFVLSLLGLRFVIRERFLFFSYLSLMTKNSSGRPSLTFTRRRNPARKTSKGTANQTSACGERCFREEKKYKKKN